jgi:hypothetical protein
MLLAISLKFCPLAFPKAKGCWVKKKKGWKLKQDMKLDCLLPEGRTSKQANFPKANWQLRSWASLNSLATSTHEPHKKIVRL